MVDVIDLKDEVQQADEAFALAWYKDSGYTDIGRAVYDIKYGYILNQSLTDGQLDRSLRFLVNALLEFTKDIDIILPVPSFNPRHENNPTGDLKIMYMIAERLGKVSRKKVDFSILEKISSHQAKDSQLNVDDYTSEILPSHIKNVLLIDDLFGEGNTANYTISVLKRANPNIEVRFVSLTKNKYGGIHKQYDCRISQYNAYHTSENGNDSIDLYFYKNNNAERVRIWANHSQFQDVKQALDINDFNKIFEFSIYKSQKGYWQIDDD
ncbi:phosphoribosyltransferase [Streptococcus suis]|uniref:phosphoribosyltransferase n=1 Tax=Streptococcus suis TaxID=1307 RepID=UPI000CF5C90F|nr:phosphoribosyltransferase [Streptococcus suis]HEM5963170.1 phosphoribosyltransferase [Streptococcus suis]HEM6309941.1 phosphoribosyltransferase [Streptococcus suis]